MAAAVGISAAVNVAKIQGFASGVVDVRRQGGASSDTILSLLTPGESVINKQATVRNRNTLQAINEGASFDGKAANSNRGLNVEVHNYAGVHVQPEKMSDDRVRILIHQETPGIVHAEAPKAVAASQRNPNGVMAKATRDTIKAPRKRA
jgi:hypothetical protein